MKTRFNLMWIIIKNNTKYKMKYNYHNNQQPYSNSANYGYYEPRFITGRQFQNLQNYNQGYMWNQ